MARADSGTGRALARTGAHATQARRWFHPAEPAGRRHLERRAQDRAATAPTEWSAADLSCGGRNRFLREDCAILQIGEARSDTQVSWCPIKPNQRMHNYVDACRELKSVRN